MPSRARVRSSCARCAASRPGRGAFGDGGTASALFMSCVRGHDAPERLAPRPSLPLPVAFASHPAVSPSSFVASLFERGWGRTAAPFVMLSACAPPSRSAPQSQGHMRCDVVRVQARRRPGAWYPGHSDARMRCWGRAQARPFLRAEDAGPGWPRPGCPPPFSCASRSQSQSPASVLLPLPKSLTSGSLVHSLTFKSRQIAR
ncbi:hypothetical protein B0H15DRAFT_815510 [Mycena belliarum]|uniref:Uncharacterized protein n=1 Tax=Mycena belliarum TaxID=1033014 RepID=A0AAD6UI52_9AGAR|nr:hypothetical protein B0H15DRAFT_815510 [Mycena belliae]